MGNRYMNKTLFGTDGIRTTVGHHPLTYQTLPQLGRAIACWAQKKYNKKIAVLLAHDTRISCSFIKSALKSGLLLEDIALYDANILPTPAICLLTRDHDNLDIGIIISASHNPYHDNGIKIVDKSGNKIDASDEKIICSFLDNQHSDHINYSSLGTDIVYEQASQYYYDYIINHFDPSFLQTLTIVLDCAHGATSDLAQKIFQYCGATVHTINNRPNGTNINNQCGALFPHNIQKAVLKYNADIGFAFDGDGDRVTIVTKEGIIKNGDDILALLSSHSQYNRMHSIVGTILTNQGLETFLKQHNKKLIRTQVGDKYVAQQLEKNNILLGGEPAGHIIMSDYLSSSDGIFSALRILETMTQTNNWDLVTFKSYPQFNVAVPISIKKDLNQYPLTTIIKEHEELLHDGRLIVRYSGTENVLRIMVEDKKQTRAEYIGKKLSQILAKELSTV